MKHYHKKIIILFIFTFNYFICQSQQQFTFFKEFDLPGIENFFWITGIQTNNGKFVVFDYGEWGMQDCEFDLFGFDSIGNSSTPIYPWSFFCNGLIEGHIDYLKNGDLFVYGDDGGGPVECNGYFNKNGKLIWFNPEDSAFVGDIYTAPDSQIIGPCRISQYINQNYFDTLYIAKANYSGHILWKTKVDSLLPSSYYISGYTYKHGLFYLLTKTGKNSQYKVIKLSSSGKLASIDSLFNMDDLEETPTGFVSFYNQDSNGIHRFSITQFDENFNIIKRYYSPADHSTYISYSFIDKQGNIHILTSQHNLPPDTTIGYYRVIKLDHNLNTINDKFYFRLKGVYGGISVESFYPTSDGGYFMTSYENNINSGGYLGYAIKTDSNGYVNDTNYIIYTSPKSLQNPKLLKNNINIYPNPLNSTCTITMSNNNKGKWQFSLYSITGSLVRKETFNSSIYQFYRNDLPGGIYIYSIVGEKGCYTGKLIINP